MSVDRTARRASEPRSRLVVQAAPAGEDVGAALPEFTGVVRGMTRMLRDVEAMRFAMRSLMPLPERELGVRLIQERFGIPAVRARKLLGLPGEPGGMP
jgi:hypothetical protein